MKCTKKHANFFCYKNMGILVLLAVLITVSVILICNYKQETKTVFDGVLVKGEKCLKKACWECKNLFL